MPKKKTRSGAKKRFQCKKTGAVKVIGVFGAKRSPLLPDVPTATLVEALNAQVGAGAYDYVATGGIGTDVIRVAFIYKPAAVTPIGDFAILDSSVDDRVTWSSACSAGAANTPASFRSTNIPTANAPMPAPRNAAMALPFATPGRSIAGSVETVFVITSISVPAQ